MRACSSCLKEAHASVSQRRQQQSTHSSGGIQSELPSSTPGLSVACWPTTTRRRPPKGAQEGRGREGHNLQQYSTVLMRGGREGGEGRDPRQAWHHYSYSAILTWCWIKILSPPPSAFILSARRSWRPGAGSGWSSLRRWRHSPPGPADNTHATAQAWRPPPPTPVAHARP